MNITDRITKLVLARKPDTGPRGVKRAIASACGISYEAVRQWYAGDTGNIKNENLAAVAEKFDTTVDWLLSGDGDPPRRGPSAPTRPAQAEPKPDQAQALLEAVAALHVIQAGLLAGVVSKEQLQRLLQIRNEIAHQKPGGAEKGHRLQGLLAAAFRADENGDSPDDLLRMYQLGMEKEFAKEGAAAHEPGKKPARRS